MTCPTLKSGVARRRMQPTEARSLPLWTPFKISIAWLLGTYLLFLVVGEVDEVPSLPKLTAFVTATIVAFTLGYRTSARRFYGQFPPSPAETRESIGQIRVVTAASAIYFAAYGLALLSVYGVASPAAILGALLDPGNAYFAKFDVYARQEALGTVSLPVQVLTLAAVFSTPLVPFLGVYMRHLTDGIRMLAAVGLGLYTLYFLSIGTLSGLGNLLIFAAVASMVVRARATTPSAGRRRRAVRLIVGLGALTFVSYMAYNQSARISTIGISDMYEPNPIVKTFAGDDFARGVTVVALYPTHGYQGLAYNLDTPFEWTKGRGASRALDSYLDQYGFGNSIYDDTYPRRTEFRTGWPAGQVWATIYPWLASDLTFPGAIAFMAVVGWWMARFWYEAIALGSRLALLLLCQLGILIAFVPANNQIGIGRPSLIAFLSLAALYVIGRVNAKFRISRSARPSLARQESR